MLIVAAALLIALAVGGTVAYLQAQSQSVTNTFVPGYVTSEVVKTVESDAITSLKVKNTGNVPAYIRVTVTGNTLDDAGYLTGNADLAEYLVADGWSLKTDGFYYYDSVVAPGGLTDKLFTKNVPLDHLLVTVLAEAIQAEGMGASDAYNAFQIAKGGS